MACPLPSLTVPWMLPPTFWAWTGSARRRPAARMNPPAPFARMGPPSPTPFRLRMETDSTPGGLGKSRGCPHRVGLRRLLGGAPPEVLRLREHVDLDGV